MQFIWKVRSLQVVTALLALGSFLIFVTWLVLREEPDLPPWYERGTLTFMAILPREMWSGYIWSGYGSYQTAMLMLLCVTGLFAACLAMLLTIKVSDRIEVQRLALGLALGAFSVSYHYFITTIPAYQDAFGWSASSPWRLLMDFCANFAFALSPLLLARFLLGYPRSATTQEWINYLTDEDDANATLRWIGRPVSRGPSQAGTAEGRQWTATFAPKFLNLLLAPRSQAAVMLAGGWALVAAVVDWLGAISWLSYNATMISKIWTAGAFGILCPMAFISATASLGLHRKGSFADDRRKVEWISVTMQTGMLLICLLFPMTLCLAYYWVPNLLDRGFFIPQIVLIWGVPVAAYILIALVFLIALSLSIFYRGTIDPRLAARKVTLIGMLGLIVTTLFIFLERLIATKLSSWLALSPDYGALLAGAVVAMTFNPIRKRTEKAINDIMGRLLPLDSVIEGERKHLVVAITDLSGYTALSARDEKQAILLAALLQRQAANITRDHAGRIVKSMGDAVLFAFDDAQSASKALTALHRDFQPAAQQLGLEMLPVHSGAHWGEVTVARDGDLYGQVVNIAARLQASSEAGQIVVSRAFAELARHVAPMRDLGLRQFKNVAERIQCEELIIA